MIQKVVFPSFRQELFSAAEMRQLVSALELRFQSLEQSVQDNDSLFSYDTDDLDLRYSQIGHTHVSAEITDLNTSIFGLDDVTGSPTVGQGLIWNGSAFEPGSVGGGGTFALNDLSDVNAGSPTDGQTIVWDDSTLRWIPGDPPTGIDTLFDLTDTDLTGQTQGDLLFNADGTEWQHTGVNFRWIEGQYIQLGNTISINWYDGDFASVEFLAVDTATTQTITGDPDFANVSLLLQPDEADGATTTVDKSSNAHTVTFNGNAEVDAVNTLFGEPTYYFDGTNSYLEIPDDVTLDLSPGSTEVYTLECHVRLDELTQLDVTDGTCLFSKWDEPSDIAYFHGIIGSTFDQLNHQYSSNGSGVLYRALSPTSSFIPAVDTWYHIAFCRQGDTLRGYVNGVQVGTRDLGPGATYNDSANPLTIGARPDGRAGLYFNWFSGNIGNIRVTKGVTRYPDGTTFTPPTTRYASGVNNEVTYSNEFIVGDPGYPTEIDGTLVGLKNDIGINWDTAAGDNVELAIFSGGITAPTTDPLWDQVVLLLPFEDANGSTTTTDVSPSAHSPITFVGAGVTVSTNQSYFDTASLRFDGTGSDYVTIPDSADFALADEAFTLEIDVYFVGALGTQTLISQYNATGDQRGWALSMTSTFLVWQWTTNGQAGTYAAFQETHLMTPGNWYRLSITRNPDNSGGTLNKYTMHINGTYRAQTNSTDVIFDSNQNVVIGANGDGSNSISQEMYIENIRLTTGPGAYRYPNTSSYSAPTDSHPAASGSPAIFTLGDPLYSTQIDGTTTTITGATQLDGTLDVDGIATFNAYVNGVLNVGDPGLESGTISVNDTDYDSILKISDFGGTKEAMLHLHRHSSTIAPLLIASRANSNDSTHTDVADNDLLFSILASGWNTDTYNLSSEIRFEVDGTPSATAMPGLISFGTAEAGSRTPTVWVSLDSSGRFLLNNLTELTPSTTDHPFQIGPDNGQNLRIDRNEIMGADNGVGGFLGLQANGGELGVGFNAESDVVFYNNTSLELRGDVAGDWIRIAHDNTNVNITTSQTSDINIAENGTRVHLPSTSDVGVATTGHPFQIGLDTGNNIRMDNNEIMAVNNGVVSGLNLNADGGDVTIGNITGGRLLLNNSTDLQFSDGVADTATFELTNATTFGTIFSGLADWDITGLTGEMFVDADLRTSGDLTVGGTTTTINSNTVSIADNIILLNSDEVGVPTENAGIEIERGTSANVQFLWNETTDIWTADQDFRSLGSIWTDEGVSAQGTVSDIGQVGAFAFMDESAGVARFGAYNYDTGPQWEAVLLQGGPSVTINAQDGGSTINLQTGNVSRLSIDGTNSRFVFNDYSIFIEERGSALPDVTGYGQLWVNTTGSALHFTDDGGVDYNLLNLGGGGSLPAGTTTNASLKWNGSAWVEDTAFRISSDHIDIRSGAPTIWFYETDATADNQNWYLGALSENFTGRAYNDAFGASTEWLSVTRTGSTTIDAINLKANITTIQAPNLADPMRIVRASPSADQVSMRFTATSTRWFGKGTDNEPYWHTAADITTGDKILHDGNDYTLLTNWIFGSAGSLRVQTNSNASPFIVQRTSSDIEAISLGVDDTIAYFRYDNDEASSTIRFTLDSADTESGGGAAANTHSWDIFGGDGRTYLSMPASSEIYMTEKSAVGGAPGVGRGILWCKDDAPSALYWTGDTGVDIDLTAGGGTIGGSITDNQIAVGATTADDIEGSSALTFDGSFIDHTGTVPFYRQTESGVTNTPVWWSGPDGGNYSWRLNNAGVYPLQFTTNATNDAVTDVKVGYQLLIDGTADYRSLHAIRAGSFLQAGADATGQSGVWGSRIQTDAAASRYSTYWGYDCYWDEGANNWVANRTTLGRKWKVEMGYHSQQFQIDYYDGVVTSPWAESAWTGLLTLNASGDLTIARDFRAIGGVSADSQVTDIGQVNQFAFIDVSGTEGRFGSYDYDTPGWQDVVIIGSNLRFDAQGGNAYFDEYPTTNLNNSATGGTTMMDAWYTGTDVLNVLGTMRSSGATMLGFAVRPSTTVAGGFVSSRGAVSSARAAIEIDASGFRVGTASSATVAVGTAVTLTDRLSIANNGTSTFSGAVIGTQYEATALGPLTSPGTDDLYVGGYGIMGDRAAAPIYVTNANATGTVQINAGGVHGASNKVASFSATLADFRQDVTLYGTNPVLELQDRGEIHFRDEVDTAEGIHVYNDSITTAAQLLKFTTTAATPRIEFRDGISFRIYGASNVEYCQMQCIDVSNYMDMTLQASLTDGWHWNDEIMDQMILRDYAIESDTQNVSGTTATLTYANGPAFECDMEAATGNVTITLSGGPPTGTHGQITVKVNQDTTVRTLAWAGGTFRWAGGTAHPITTTANGFTIYTFETWDGGTTWYGSGADYS